MNIYMKYYKNEDGSYLFKYRLPQSGNLVNSLNKQIEYIRKIEEKYNDFTYEFDGKNCNIMALIPVNKKIYLKSLTKHGGVNEFLKTLTNHLKEVAGIIDNDYLSSKHVTLEKYIPCIRFHNETGLKPVEVFSTDTVETILLKSSVGDELIGLNELDLIKWGRLTPDIKKPKVYQDFNFTELPVCIKSIMNKFNKSNKEVNYLIRYFLSICSPTNTRKILNAILTDTEKERLKKIRVTEQFNYILNNLDSLGCPNCLELKKYCKNCNKPHPLVI